MTLYVTDEALESMARERYGDKVNIPEFIRGWRENTAIAAARKAYTNERESALDALQHALHHADQQLSGHRERLALETEALTSGAKRSFLQMVEHSLEVHNDEIGGRRAGSADEYATAVEMAGQLYDRSVAPILARHDDRVTALWQAYERATVGAHEVYAVRMERAKACCDAAVSIATRDAHERGEHGACLPDGPARCDVAAKRALFDGIGRTDDAA